MAKAAGNTADITTGSQTDDPGQDAFDIEPPEGTDLEPFERAIQAPADEKPAAKQSDEASTTEAKAEPATTVAAATAPATAGKEPKGSTGKALAKERQVSKDLRAANKRLRDQWAEIESERTVGMKTMTGALPPLQVRVDKSKPDAIVQSAVEAEARGESVHPTVIKGVLNAVDEAAQKATEKLGRETRRAPHPATGARTGRGPGRGHGREPHRDLDEGGHLRRHQPGHRGQLFSCT